MMKKCVYILVFTIPMSSLWAMEQKREMYLNNEKKQIPSVLNSIDAKDLLKSLKKIDTNSERNSLCSSDSGIFVMESFQDESVGAGLLEKQDGRSRSGSYKDSSPRLARALLERSSSGDSSILDELVKNEKVDAGAVSVEAKVNTLRKTLSSPTIISAPTVPPRVSSAIESLPDNTLERESSVQASEGFQHSPRQVITVSIPHSSQSSSTVAISSSPTSFGRGQNLLPLGVLSPRQTHGKSPLSRSANDLSTSQSGSN